MAATAHSPLPTAHCPLPTAPTGIHFINSSNVGRMDSAQIM